MLKCFADFTHDDLSMPAQEFEDYKSKYLDIWTYSTKEKVSILNDVDFELELIHRDEINVTYIIKLLARLVNTPDYETRRKEIMNMLGGEAKLRSKKELIERFIIENLPQIEDGEDVQQAFDKYWSAAQLDAFEQICKEEDLHPEKFQGMVEDYLYHEKEPLRDKVLETRKGAQPSILERKTITERTIGKMKGFVETFINGIGE
jgi:type I restriction enzyme R subunit